MLEIGCDAWLYYAEPSGVAPETLICTNISQRELDQGISAARTTRLQPDFRLMDAHTLDFPDHSFDVVFGMSILHHLELERVLKEIADTLQRNPSWKLRIEGHTDGLGSDAANLDLSKRRSAAVRDVLAGRFKIAGDRLVADGKGERVPKATNDTAEGRAQNRRVELTRQ